MGSKWLIGLALWSAFLGAAIERMGTHLASALYYAGCSVALFCTACIVKALGK